jgi:hypothetical protein
MAGPETLNDERGAMNDAETRIPRRWTMNESAERAAGAGSRKSRADRRSSDLLPAASSSMLEA